MNSIFERQRDILFEACKKIATNKRCPEWVSECLRTAVMQAKQIKEEFPEFEKKDNEPLKIGDKIEITNPNNKMTIKAEIIYEPESPDNLIKIFHVKVIEGDKYHNNGDIFHNVPGNWMKKIC